MKKIFLSFVFVLGIVFSFSFVSAELKTLGSIEYSWTDADKQIATKIISLIEKKPRKTQENWIGAIDTILFQNQNLTTRARAILNAIQLNVRGSRENAIVVSPESNFGGKILTREYINHLVEKFEEVRNLKPSYKEGEDLHLQQGSFSARYLPSENLTNDQIRIFDGTNTKTFPLFYNSRNAEILKKMKREPEAQLRSDLLGNGGLLFSRFIGFSPSGYYLNIQLDGWEYSQAIMMDVSNGEIVLTYSPGHEIWTPDRKQFVWGNQIGMGGGDLGLNITIVGSFPNYKTIMNDRQIESIIIDGEYLAIKSSILSEEMTHYYISLVDSKNYKVIEEVKLAK